MVPSRGLVDFCYLGVKAGRDSVGLNVAEGPQKGKGISVDVDVVLILLLGDRKIFRGDRTGLILRGFSGRLKEGLYRFQVDEDATGRRGQVDRGKSAIDAVSVRIVYADLLAVVVKERVIVVQRDGKTKIVIRRVKNAILAIVLDYFLVRNDGPVGDLGASEDRRYDGSWMRRNGKGKQNERSHFSEVAMAKVKKASLE